MMIPPLSNNSGMPMLMSALKPEDMHEQQHVPLYIEPTLGWRAWNIYVDNRRNGRVRLQSITHKLRWPPKIPFRARCLIKQNLNHQPPDKIHKCGIYAVKSEEDALKWLNYNRGSSVLRGFGEVKLWGNVLRYEKGYIAEYAYPKSVFIDHEFPDRFPYDAREIVRELRRTYRGVNINML